MEALLTIPLESNSLELNYNISMLSVIGGVILKVWSRKIFGGSQKNSEKLMTDHFFFQIFYKLIMDSKSDSITLIIS